MKLTSLLLSFVVTLFIFTGCSEDGEKKRNDEFLPRASLVPHEILVVMDSSQWNGVLGNAIRDVYTIPIQGLPQEEPQFTLRHVTPENLRGFLKRYPNILFALTLDKKSRSSEVLRSMFSEESLQQIKNEPQRYMVTRQNEFAKGQEVLYLIGTTEDQLVSRIYTQQEQLLEYFLNKERERNMREYANIKVSRELKKTLKERFGFTLNFPAGYEVAKQDSNFVWVRLLDNKVDKSVWATWRPYTDQSLFTKDSLLAFRNRVVKNYIWGDDETTFMRLEEQIPVVTKEVNFNGDFAIEARGLWRLEKMVMGGPFISYTFVDEATNRLYYLEGFTYAPGEDKRAAISELEAILRSFKSTPQAADNRKATSPSAQ